MNAQRRGAPAASQGPDGSEVHSIKQRPEDGTQPRVEDYRIAARRIVESDAIPHKLQELAELAGRARHRTKDPRSRGQIDQAIYREAKPYLDARAGRRTLDPITTAMLALSERGLERCPGCLRELPSLEVLRDCRARERRIIASATAASLRCDVSLIPRGDAS